MCNLSMTDERNGVYVCLVYVIRSFLVCLICTPLFSTLVSITAIAISPPTPSFLPHSHPPTPSLPQPKLNPIKNPTILKAVGIPLPLHCVIVVSMIELVSFDNPPPLNLIILFRQSPDRRRNERESRACASTYLSLSLCACLCY